MYSVIILLGMYSDNLDLKLIRRFATNMELISYSENYFIYRSDYKFDLKELWKRYLILYYSPKIQYQYYLLSRDNYIEMITFNRNYKQFLLAHQTMFTDKMKEYYEIDYEIEKTDDLHEILLLAYSIRNPNYSVYRRRLWLEQYIDKVGIKEFYLNKIPPAVPLGYFRMIDN